MIILTDVAIYMYIRILKNKFKKEVGITINSKETSTVAS